MVVDIFGIKLKFQLDESPESKILKKELSCYKQLNSSEPYDIIIQYKGSNHDIGEAISNNPGIHSLHEDGFSMKSPNITSRFILENKKLKKIIFFYNTEKKSKIKSVYQKWKNIQFLGVKESIGQVVHELLLVPINFFIPDRSLIHSSAVVTPKGKLLLFGGTGGVGKTSLELELCKNHNCTFFADDISIADSTGTIFPNLSFPKIYAYNLINDIDLKKIIFKKNNILDRLHWHIHSLRGLNKVRRRLPPSTLYNKTTNAPQKINRFFILNRTKVDQIEIEKIENLFASELNTEIIKSEYQVIFQQFYWFKYNSLLNGQNGFINFEDLMISNTNTFCDALNSTGAISYIIKIPIQLKNEDLKNNVSKLLYELDLI